MKRFKELRERIYLAIRVLRSRDGGLVRHACDELELAGYRDDDKMNAQMASDVVDLLRVFGAQGHSGFSAGFARQLFGTLSGFKPLGPLTGADNEWMCVSEMSGEPMWQNRRCSHVFRGADGIAYDIDAVVFEEPNGSRFTGRHSRRVIEFPYSPRRVVAQVPDDATEVQKAMLADQAWNKAA